MNAQSIPFSSLMRVGTLKQWLLSGCRRGVCLLVRDPDALLHAATMIAFIANAYKQIQIRPNTGEKNHSEPFRHPSALDAIPPTSRCLPFRHSLSCIVPGLAAPLCGGYVAKFVVYEIA